MSDATTVQMPQRWDFAGDYDDYLVPLEEGDYVKVEDVNPLVAEIERLRARVEVLERVRVAAQALDGYRFGWLGWEEKVEALRVALKEAKP